jgi:hypothetical protein
MEPADSPPGAAIYRVAVRLPQFWPERPTLWFAQAEAQFELAGITSERTKYSHVISHLDHRYAAEVEDIITSPPERDQYTTLKTELVTRLSVSRDQRVRQLLMHEEMGDRKPSQFLWHLKSLAPDDFLRSQKMALHVVWLCTSNQTRAFTTAFLCPSRQVPE